MRLGSAQLGSSEARLGGAASVATGPIYIDYEHRRITAQTGAYVSAAAPASVTAGATATIEHPEPGER
jgi:hypothetical protein